LDRVKADAGPEDRELSLVRQSSEMETVGCSDLLLASCDVEADQLVELYGAERDRIEVVAPGVNHAIFGPGDRVQARRAIGWPQDVPLVLFVGRIQPLKGPSVAVEALGLLRTRTSDRLQRASLMVIGGPSGPQGAGELSALERSVAAYGLKDRVTCVPPQRHELLSTSYRAADVVIVPSRSESFGLVALEASACGIPVVASAVGGLTTLVDHGRTGFLVEGRDPSQFAHHLGTLIGHPEIAATMGHAAGRRARAYTWTVAASRLEHRVVQITSRQLVACR
jgi:D-inositol-3-phosphate glycosyltransferase